MSDRLNEYFDGSLEASDLTPQERREVERIEAAAATAARTLPELETDFAPAVLQRIRELGLEPAPPAQQDASRSRWSARAAAAALWTPRTVSLRLRPAYGLAAAALLALVVGTQVVPTAGRGTEPVAAAEPASIFVQFRLDAVPATQVAIAGSFTDWQPSLDMVESAPGVWTLVTALPPGIHDYAFIVDGEHWVPDPLAIQVDDGFGGFNSRLALLPPGWGEG